MHCRLWYLEDKLCKTPINGHVQRKVLDYWQMIANLCIFKLHKIQCMSFVKHSLLLLAFGGFLCVCVCVVLGLELRVFTLSHSTSPIFVKGFLR
jgi:hypothetical protein